MGNFISSPNKINFTKAALDALRLPPNGKRAVYHDKNTKYLQLRVTSNGTKTFSIFRRVKDGNLKRVTIGRYPEMCIKRARKEAERLNALIAENIRSRRIERFKEYLAE